VQNKKDVRNIRSVSSGVDLIGTLQRFAAYSFFLLSVLRHVVERERGKKN
jgi:hypothetical protein